MIHTVNTVCGSVISLGAMSFAGCSAPAKPSLHNKHAQSSQLLSLLFIQHVLCPGRKVGWGWRWGWGVRSIDSPSPTAAPRAIMRGAQCCFRLIFMSTIIISTCFVVVVVLKFLALLPRFQTNGVLRDQPELGRSVNQDSALTKTRSHYMFVNSGDLSIDAKC